MLCPSNVVLGEYARIGSRQEWSEFNQAHSGAVAHIEDCENCMKEVAAFLSGEHTIRVVDDSVPK